MRRRTSASLCLLVLQLLVAQEKQTLAVLESVGFGISGFEIQTLTNRLRTNLTQLGVYRIIERGLMLQILLEQDFQMTGCFSDEFAVEVGQLFGAQSMLAGSIGKVGNTWTVEMRIVDVETGAIVETIARDNRGEDALDCLNFPPQHRQRIRTTNGLERFNQEIKQRTRIIRIFPNRNAALRLIGALCMELAEEWLTGRKYLDMSLLKEANHEQEAETRLEAA